MANRNSLFLLIFMVWALYVPSDPQSARPEFKPFRYDEDWSFLANPRNRRDWLDPVK